jgi:UPF0716 protein FxsA
VAPGLGPQTRGVRRPRLRRWSALLVLLLLVVPLLEVVVIIAVGRVIGGWPTFGLLLAESAFGAWLVRREGSRTWLSLQEALTTGRMPSRQLADAALVLVGGVLLLAPGFLTDVVGFFLVIPVTRPLARRLLEAVVARRLLSGIYAPTAGLFRPGAPADHGSPRTARTADDVIEGEVL